MIRLVCLLVLDSPLLHNLLTYGPPPTRSCDEIVSPGCDNCLHKANLGSYFSH